MVLVNAVGEVVVPDCTSANLGQTTITLNNKHISTPQRKPLDFLRACFDEMKILKVNVSRLDIGNAQERSAGHA